MPYDVMIGPQYGPNDPPPIAITVKDGSRTVIRIELTPENLALALTGRLVQGEITRGNR